jgi:hypothetical protein
MILFVTWPGQDGLFVNFAVKNSVAAARPGGGKTRAGGNKNNRKKIFLT